MAQIDLHRRRGLLNLIATASALLCLQTSGAASDVRQSVQLRNADRQRFDDLHGTYSGRNVELVQGSSVLKASNAEATGIVDQRLTNSTWKLTGSVHLEFDGAVLDTQSATVIFAQGQMKSVQTQAVGTAAAVRPGVAPVHVEMNGTVMDAHTALVNFAGNRIRTVQVQGIQGSPARFSHQLKNAKTLALGRAAKIEYDAVETLIRFSGGAWFSKGSFEAETQEPATYNTGTGVFESEGKSSGFFRTEERVPSPSTPDRATAK